MADASESELDGYGRPMEVNTDQPDIQACDLYPGAEDDDGNVTWAVDVPDDATVEVRLVVRADGVEELVGGGTGADRYELTAINAGGGSD